MPSVEARLRAALLLATDATSDLDLNPDLRAPTDAALRRAAVLVAVALWPDLPQVILTKRSSRLLHHPGQIAFAGGKVDATDAGPVAAARREAWEEIGLPPSQVEVIGELPRHVTVTGYVITPVVGLVRTAFQIRREVGEVDEVFMVPLAHVLALSRYTIQQRAWMGSLRRYYTVPHGPHYIWGATARILRGLADRMAA